MMPLLWKDYTPFEKQDTRIAAFGQSIPIWVQKEILCIPSKKYNLVNELKQINNLSANTISIGQRLIVK
jgi:hypothetical protein